MEFHIGTPVHENFMKGKPEEFFIGIPTPGVHGTSSQDPWAEDDETAGGIERWQVDFGERPRTMRFHVSRGGGKSVLGRAAPDYKISGVAGRREVGTWESGSGR